MPQEIIHTPNFAGMLEDLPLFLNLRRFAFRLFELNFEAVMTASSRGTPRLETMLKARMHGGAGWRESMGSQ